VKTRGPMALLDGPSFLGITPGTYEAWKAGPPAPSVTLEMLERGFRAMLNAPIMRTVELHPTKCPMWKTGSRLDCRCSPGWMDVPVEAP